MIAPAHATPAPLAAYLRRATWGLPKTRQQELWDELEEHLLTRAEQLCVLGASPEQALSQALRELGPPSRVSAGMTQVYLMPKMILSATAVALALSAALYAAAGGSQGTITLPVLTQRPAKPSCVRGTVPPQSIVTVVSQQGGVTCYTFKNPSLYSGAYISLSDLKAALEAQGGRARFLTPTRLNVDLPGLGGGTVNARFSQNGQGYLDANTIISGLGTPLPVTVRGFAAPEIQIGRVRLQLGSSSQPGIGKNFYRGLTVDLVDRLVTPDQDEAHSLTVYHGDSGYNKAPTHTVQTGLKPGEVVLLVTRKGPDEYTADIAPVQADGGARLLNSSQNLRFVSNPAQLSPYPSGGRVPALLVRVTNVPLNNLNSGIFIPTQPTSDAN